MKANWKRRLPALLFSGLLFGSVLPGAAEGPDASLPLEAPGLAELCEWPEPRPAETEAADGLTFAEEPEEVRATVYLAVPQEEGTSWLPLCTVPASREEDGCFRARFSGMVPVWQGEEPLPLFCEEKREGERILLTSERIALSGEEIFFARLILTAETGPAEEDPRLEQRAASPELELVLEPGAEKVPCALFDTVRAYALLYEAEPGGNGPEDTVFTEAGVRSLEQDTKQLLRVALVEAESLGELAWCFEYYFEDGSGVFHFLPEGGLTP